MTTQEKLIESKLNLLDAGVFAGHGLVLRREVGSRLALRAGRFGGRPGCAAWTVANTLAMFLLRARPSLDLIA